MKSRLKEILEERGIKQTWLAKKIGVRISTINSLVTKGGVPTLPVAYRIAKALGLKIEDIWYEEEAKKEPTQSK
jgi:putative transcriptional regulator